MTAISGDRTVLALGELLWDVLPHERLLGGAPANFCHRLRQLGASARMVSRVGDDDLGKELLSELSQLSFDLSLVQIDPRHRTGTVDVVLTPEGNPHFTINPDVAYDYLELTPDLLEAARTASFVSFGTLVQRSEHARKTVYAVLEAATQATKFLDINLRRDCYSGETVIESLHRADILKLNESEVTIISTMLDIQTTSPKDFAETIMQRFSIDTVLITLGEDGAYASNAAGHECQVAGIAITVADTIGSGDSFSAGFAFKYLQNAPLEECCLFGNFIGALNATKKGGMPDISWPEVEEFVRRYSSPPFRE